MRIVLPLAKCREGIHTIETAHALSQLGGEPGHLCNALWQAQGDEFTVQKTEYGYMIAVSKPVDPAQVETWAEEISGINLEARTSDIGKLDAVYLALDRAAKQSSKSSTPKDGISDKDEKVEETTSKSVDQTLNELIDGYFAADADDDPSAVVAESAEARATTLLKALGGEVKLSASTEIAGVFGRSSGSNAGAKARLSQPIPSTTAASVHQMVARLVMGAEWPKVGTDDPDSIARAAAQFLSGINTDMLPAKTWKTHACWGKFRDFGDFDHLEELVRTSVTKLRSAQAAKAAQATPATATAASRVSND